MAEVMAKALLIEMTILQLTDSNVIMTNVAANVVVW